MRHYFLAAALSLAGCATAPAVPEQTAGVFSLERDLAGETTARGAFHSITGTERGFTAHLHGHIEGDIFVLTEDFIFDDGERDRKTWRLTRIAPGRYSGTREDVIGEAVGYQDGPAFRLEYKVRLPSDNGRGLVVRFRDVLVETRDGNVLNRANVGYFGLRVARVELNIERAR
jgi:hypothetical protein